MIEIDETRTYVVDPERLKKEFPNEWAEFDGDERAFIQDAIENILLHNNVAGLLRFVDSEVFIYDKI